ncbi:MAG: hypothetical protein CM1200mP10_19880 [Candidatus Neomarinimicrobiota bacterium]|nr:MAG: hypothetical protein CM1200mP10_19880 [Candidatus Neomarinimicrobiota bacterium]
MVYAGDERNVFYGMNLFPLHRKTPFLQHQIQRIITPVQPMVLHSRKSEIKGHGGPRLAGNQDGHGLACWVYPQL